MPEIENSKLHAKYAIFQDLESGNFFIREYTKGETYDKKAHWLITICNSKQEAVKKLTLLENDAKNVII